MATESVQNLSVQIAINEEAHCPNSKYANGFAGSLWPGQELYVSADNTVNKRTDGSQYMVGVAQYKGLEGGAVVVGVAKRQTVVCGVIKGGAVTAGLPVIPNGNVVLDANGEQTGIEYVVAASGDKAYAVAKTGALVNGTFSVEYVGHLIVVP